MQITGIKPVTKAKYQIEIDGEPAFVLYKGELSKFALKEDALLSQEVYEKIYELLLRRAKLRAMRLLEAMGRTEQELYRKLKTGGYPEAVIEQALSYVKSFGYVDDARYIRNFMESRQHTKSKKEIKMLLMQKGLDRSLITDIMEEYISQDTSQDYEVEAIKALLRKKKYDPSVADLKEKQKIYAYLARKGFRYELIRQVIQVSDGFD